MKNVEKFRRNMRISMGIFIALFSIVIVYLGYSVITYGEKWFATPYNPRLQKAMQTASAGKILDRDGVKLAWSDGNSRKYHSSKDVRRAVSHVVGDVKGKSMGAETIFARYIYGLDKDVLGRVDDVLAGKTHAGSDVTLTIDSELSEYIYDNMEARNGSVVVMNYKTGEVLASVSIPTFDPSTLEDDTPQDTSLVDRATMGRYPPGSIMKVVTASAAIEEGIDIKYTCTGEDIIEGQKVTCVKNHGEQTLTEAFENSCNTYFANLSIKIGGQRLLAQAEKFGFNQDYNFSDVILYKSGFEVSNNEGDVAWAGIGQYNDLITPMHAAMIAGAVANDGVMMEPKVLRDVDLASFRFSPSVYKKVLDADTAALVKEYMRNVVTKGTGTSAAVKGMNIFGKTGTAEFYEDGEVKNHSWFIGFTDDPDHPYSIAVIFEGAGFGSRYAAPMAGKVLKQAVKLAG